MSVDGRILHVLNYSLPYVSGYCTRTHHILRAQRSVGLDVIAVTSPRHNEIIPDAPEREEMDGILYIRTAAPGGFLSTDSVTRARRLVSSLAEKIEETAEAFRPTIIHAHSPSLCAMAGSRVASRLAVPFVYEVRALWEDAAVDQKKMGRFSWRYLASRYVETRMLRRADRVVVLCEALAREMGRRAGDSRKVSVIPNGVDHALFSPREKSERILGELGLRGATVVGFIGTFFRFEGLDDLVSAFEKVAPSHPDACLLLVGEGELGPRLKKLLGDIPHRERVLLVGSVPHEEILDYYSIMDVMVYPRRRIRLTELVTPLKPLEAMAMAKPVLVSDVGGLVELIGQKGAGAVFRAGDVDHLAERLEELLDDEGLRRQMGASARSYIVAERGWDSIVKRYKKIYDELAG